MGSGSSKSKSAPSPSSSPVAAETSSTAAANTHPPSTPSSPPAQPQESASTAAASAKPPSASQGPSQQSVSSLTQQSQLPPSTQSGNNKPQAQTEGLSSTTATTTTTTTTTTTVKAQEVVPDTAAGVADDSTSKGGNRQTGETSVQESTAKSAAQDSAVTAKVPKVSGKPRTAMADDESVLPLEPEAQRQFDTALRATNALVCQEALLKWASSHVTKLSLRRALPPLISLTALMAKLDNLQVLDVSGNSLGPQAVRVMCLSLPASCPLLSLCLADNKTDTDTAESVGRVLTDGPPLVYLDVSSNYLGKDYFSRCVGQALKTNTSLQTLRAQSIGMVDATVLLEGLLDNTTLVEVDLSHNQITNRQALGAGLAAVLKKPQCALQSLAVAGCNMDSAGLTLLAEGLAANTSLLALNLNNNQFGSLQTLMAVVAVCVSHPCLQNLHLNDAAVTDTALQGPPQRSSDDPSPLQVLSLHSSNVTDEFLAQLADVAKGRLPCLADLDLSNNPTLTGAAVDSLWKLTADADGRSSLVKLTCAMTEMKELAALLTVERFPQVSYLNVRKGRLSPHGLSALAGVIAPAGLPLTTLVLDGMKLSGKKELAALLGHCPSSQLTALSLSSCSLNDGDLSPLLTSLGSGFKCHMLKLSANRLTDATLTGLAEHLGRCGSHPLGVLDLSENQITDTGVTSLCGVYNTKKHVSTLHSLNLANNAIGREGILSLLCCVGGKSPLKCLYLNNQSASFLETDIDVINSKLAAVLGYTVQKSGETIQKGCSGLPSLPDGLVVNLRGLGGHTGELGSLLDCAALVTDCPPSCVLPVGLQHVMELSACLQGSEGGQCTLSAPDWTQVTGAGKDNSIPSWLQVCESRQQAVYLSNLPGNCTSQRLEALFEMEADCNIEEVFLVKDPVTKNNSGTAWVLFSDRPSVQRALDFYLSGQAQVFGTAFTVSTLPVTVDDAGSSDPSAKARHDMAARKKARAAEDRAHRQLLQQNAQESWKRHAYRLAHPAYADGRIW